MILHRLLLLLLCLLATSLSAQRPAFRDSGVSIIRLGNDTSFVHRFELRGDSFYSQILALPHTSRAGAPGSRMAICAASGRKFRRYPLTVGGRSYRKPIWKPRPILPASEYSAMVARPTGALPANA